MLGRLLQEAARGAEAGVGENGVETAEGVGRRLDEVFAVLPLGDVAADGDRLVRPAELGRERFELVL